MVRILILSNVVLFGKLDIGLLVDAFIHFKTHSVSLTCKGGHFCNLYHNNSPVSYLGEPFTHLLRCYTYALYFLTELDGGKSPLASSTLTEAVNSIP